MAVYDKENQSFYTSLPSKSLINACVSGGYRSWESKRIILDSDEGLVEKWGDDTTVLDLKHEQLLSFEDAYRVWVEDTGYQHSFKTWCKEVLERHKDRNYESWCDTKNYMFTRAQFDSRFYDRSVSVKQCINGKHFLIISFFIDDPDEYPYLFNESEEEE